MEFEDCTEIVVQTAHAMGMNITTADISISQRLQTRSRRKDKQGPNIAKFMHRSVKNEVFDSNYRLKKSLGHYKVYVQEHLTEARSRVFHRMKEAGFRVSTIEPRLLHTHDGKYEGINSLAEISSKTGRDRANVKEVFLI